MGFLTRLFEERFHVSQTPPAWVKSAASWETAAGVEINPETSLQMTAVFACVRVLAETVASLPLVTYRRLDNGKARATEHRLYSLLHDLPNPEMTSFELRETMMGHVATWGNAFGELVINNAGDVVELWPLRPDRMKVARVDGRLQYEYTLPKPNAQGKSTETLSQSQVLHIHGLGFNGITGYSPIQLARQAVALGLATEEFGARFFGNGAAPGFALKHPGQLGETAHKRLRENWEDRHMGLNKSHRIAILEEGLSIEKIGIPPEDAQFLQTRKFQIAEIARIFRVPLHLVGDLDRATFSNIEHQSLEFVIYSLMPWLVRWEQAIQRDLMTPAERQSLFVEFLVDGLLRGDVQSRYQAYAIGRQWGWLSANDVRRLENMNPVKGGDLYLVPMNMIPADQASLTPADLKADRALGPALVTGEERARRSATLRYRLMAANTRVIADTMARILRREVNDVGAQARKQLASRDLGSFLLWLGDFYRDHHGFVAEQMGPVLMTYGEGVTAAVDDEVGPVRADDLPPEVERFVQRYIEAYASRHTAESEERIRQVVAEAIGQGRDPIEALEEIVFPDWRDQRWTHEAQDESTRFNNALAKAVYILVGIKTFRWVAFGQSCPYCRDLDGTVVGTEKYFLEAGAEFQPDGADRPLTTRTNIGHPPAHKGCDCLVMAGF